MEIWCSLPQSTSFPHGKFLVHRGSLFIFPRAETPNESSPSSFWSILEVWGNFSWTPPHPTSVVITSDFDPYSAFDAVFRSPPGSVKSLPLFKSSREGTQPPSWYYSMELEVIFPPSRAQKWHSVSIQWTPSHLILRWTVFVPPGNLICLPHGHGSRIQTKLSFTTASNGRYALTDLLSN